MKEAPRFVIANLLAYPTVAWVGYGLYHFTQPPRDAWWAFPWTMTVLFIAAACAFGVAYAWLKFVPETKGEAK